MILAITSTKSQKNGAKKKAPSTVNKGKFLSFSSVNTVQTDSYIFIAFARIAAG